MTDESITFDSVLDLCQNQHRRIVLAVLIEEQRSLTLDDLTKAVLKYNHHTSLTEASENERTETRLLLYHIHISKLVSEGLISYDFEKKVVEPIGVLEQMEPTLSTILDADPVLEAPMEV